MSTTADWLQRLNAAHDYGELQEIFSEMAAQAREEAHHPELARSIDEAVRRLEEERARDEDELRHIRQRYEQFQEQHRGFVGWIKRHIPFTETRKQDVGHREEVADQEAEILADNLVIARAQVLKERLLSPADRRLGRRPPEWRAELAGSRTAGRPAPLADVLQRLADEADRSRAFLDEIRKDIDAFAGANFKAKQDRQRRDADLAASRQEFELLTQEVDEELALKREGLAEVCSLVATELTTEDVGFRSDGTRVKAVQGALDRLEESLSATAGLTAAARAAGDLVRQMHALPAEMQQLRETIQRTDRQRDEAALAAARKSAVFEERRTRYEEAQRACEQKQHELEGAERLYKAYLSEPRAEQSMSIPVEADPNSPLLRRRSETKAAVEAAQAALREVTPPYQTARQQSEMAQTALAEATSLLESQQRKLSELEQQAPQLRRELAPAIDRGQREFAATAAALAAYLTTERALGAAPTAASGEMVPGARHWISSAGLERPLADALFEAERDYQRHLQAMTALEQLHRWHERQREALRQEQATLRGRREAACRRRCRELLGDALADEACAAFKLD